MKIVVIGKNGQLSSEFRYLKEADQNWKFLSSRDLDITNKFNVLNYFELYPCDIIINCAAYTNVDKAEDELDDCYLLNKNSVQNLIEACKLNNSKLIHFSTDYVFDGNKSTPYFEDEIPNPIGVYGKSKLAGEIVVKKSSVKSIIIRTSWLYSRFGNNFVKTMIKLGNNQNTIGVVNDQVGSPTYAGDLVMVVLKILKSHNYNWTTGDIFNVSNEGSCSWYEFADEIFKLTNQKINLNKLTASDYKTKAKRPNFSLLSKEKISNEFNIKISDWRSSLKIMLNKI